MIEDALMRKCERDLQSVSESHAANVFPHGAFLHGEISGDDAHCWIIIIGQIYGWNDVQRRSFFGAHPDQFHNSASLFPRQQEFRVGSILEADAWIRRRRRWWGCRPWWWRWRSWRHDWRWERLFFRTEKAEIFVENSSEIFSSIRFEGVENKFDVTADEQNYSRRI